MKKALPLLLLLCFLAGNAFSQAFHWAQQAGANLNDLGYGIAVDITGNSYVTGSFIGTITFPGGNSFTSLGSSDIFVAKYNPAGTFLWARQAKGLFNDWGNAISVDSMGNVYVTGIVGGGTVQFSSTQSINTGAGIDDIFIAKYNATGVLQWVLRCGGPNLDYGSGIAAHSTTGNFYVTGVFEGTAVFNTTAGPSTTLTSNGGGDIFVAYYNTNGVLQWVKGVGGANSDYGFSIAIDAQKNAYVTGAAGSSFIWGGTNLTAIGGSDGFVAKYGPGGNVFWVRTMVGPNADSGSGISVDFSGSPFVVGSYQDVLHFSSTGISLNSMGHNREIFIARYNTNGQLLWARSAGGPTYDTPGGICVRDTNPYVTGLFTGTASFGGQSLTSVGSQDIFVARYDPNGTLLWVRRAGGAQADSGSGIGVDGAGHAYITGGYQSNPAGFPGTGNLTNSNTTTSNIFVAEIH